MDNKGLWIPYDVLQLDISMPEKVVLATIKNLSNGRPCTATNRALCEMLNMPEITLKRCLRKLGQKGYIKTVIQQSEPNSKKRTITPYQSDTPYQNDTPYQSDTGGGYQNDMGSGYQSDTGGGYQSDTIENKEKIKRKKVEEKKPAPTSIFDIDQDVLHFYQDNIQLITKPFEVERLADDIEHFGAAKCIEAIKRAVLRNKRSLGYVESILRSWEVNGYDEGQKAPAPPPPKEKLKYFGEGDDY